MDILCTLFKFHLFSYQCRYQVVGCYGSLVWAFFGVPLSFRTMIIFAKYSLVFLSTKPSMDLLVVSSNWHQRYRYIFFGKMTREMMLCLSQCICSEGSWCLSVLLLWYWAWMLGKCGASCAEKTFFLLQLISVLWGDILRLYKDLASQHMFTHVSWIPLMILVGQDDCCSVCLIVVF